MQIARPRPVNPKFLRPPKWPNCWGCQSDTFADSLKAPRFQGGKSDIVTGGTPGDRLRSTQRTSTAGPRESNVDLVEPIQLLSLAEAARRLGVTVYELTKLADDGAVTFEVTPGGHRRFRATIIEEAAQDVVASADPAGVDILAADQAAALLRLHPRTVTRLADEGELPGRKIGGSWRFSRSQLISWIEAGSNEPAPER